MSGAKRKWGPGQRHPSRYIVDADGCHVWQLSTTTNGYPITTQKGKRIMAHKQAYVEAKGAIPTGLTLDHLCRNRLCINPEHLEPITLQENIRRSPRIKLTAARVQAIRDLYATGKHSQQSIATNMGVSREHVRDIINGKRCANVGS